MNSLALIPFILLAGGVLAFALARIAIRLQQAPGLAALTSVMICWQLIVLMAGRAPLASSVLLLISACALLIVARWLKFEAALGRGMHAMLLALAALLWAGAATFPLLTPGQILAFFCTLLACAGGAYIAQRRARTPVSQGAPGLAPLILIGLWLIVRSAVSAIAVTN